jgi:hypothetical protein
MAKPKVKAVKTPKKRSTKYGKLAAVCAKELSVKKAALVRAEKALAKAQRTHTELLSEVARLDMLDRSLKALINGTEPPQNVKYVYSYPQWVWYGNNGGWWWNGYTWTYTLGQTGVNTPNTQWNYTTCHNLQNAQQINTINTVAGDAPVFTTTSSSSNLTGTSGLTLCNANAGSSLIGYNSSGISLDNSGSIPSSYTFTTPSIPSGPSTSGTAELTVDLSTGATEEAAEVKEPEAEVAKVGHGG